MIKSERVALEHIRTVVESVLGTPAPVTTSAFGEPAVLSVPYVRQVGEGADKFTHDSGAAAGCMLVHAYTPKRPTVDEFFVRTGMTSDKPLSPQQVAKALASYSILTDTRYSQKVSDIYDALAFMKPVILILRHQVLREVGLTTETTEAPHYLAAVGFDVDNIYIHDPLRNEGDESGRALRVPLMIFYEAWNKVVQAIPSQFDRAAIIPKFALRRRMYVTSDTLNIRKGPGTNFEVVGNLKKGDLFEVSQFQANWGMIEENQWVSLTYAADI